MMRACCLIAMLVSITPAAACAQSRQAPPGLFKDLDDAILGDAILIDGKELFIDDHLIAEMNGVERVLHQPVKHPKNPILVRDPRWENSSLGYGTVLYDPESRLFRMWHEIWEWRKSESTLLGYATSKDGLVWERPVVNPKSGNNIVQTPAVHGFQAVGIFRDPNETDAARRFKMLFSCNPDGTAKTWMTSAAFSADGLRWAAAPELPLIPFSDTQNCPFWDRRRQRYVAFLRFGPPNTRIVARTESEDFQHWSPKVTVLRQTKMDGPLLTQFYQMAPMPYGNGYLGLVAAYHNETLKPPQPEAPWTDRKNLHLAWSRNGVTWSRVGRHGAIPAAELQQDRDWKTIAQEAVFLPYGEKDKDWDWGTVSPYFTPEPLIVDDEIRLYYWGQNGRNWWTYSGDPPQLVPDARPPDQGVGLATLRLDGFVSIDAKDAGTVTTKPVVFLGDALVVNANAAGGSLVVEALDANGKPIEGFAAAQCQPVTTDSVRHVIAWKDHSDCRLLQGRPIRLRFHLKAASLYSLEPRIRHKHYLPSYD